MSEWRDLPTGADVFAALAAGDEIQSRISGSNSTYGMWDGCTWFADMKFRARPKAETVTLRKALFRTDMGIEYAAECNTKYVENEDFFVCWLGEPVTYEVKK